MTQTPDKAAVERAISETLSYYDQEFPLEKYPDRENFLVSEDAGGITVGQLRSLRSSEQPSGGNVEEIHKLIMRHSDQLSMEEVRTLAHDIAAIAPSGDALVGDIAPGPDAYGRYTALQPRHEEVDVEGLGCETVENYENLFGRLPASSRSLIRWAILSISERGLLKTSREG